MRLRPLLVLITAALLSAPAVAKEKEDKAQGGGPPPHAQAGGKKAQEQPQKASEPADQPVDEPADQPPARKKQPTASAAQSDRNGPSPQQQPEREPAAPKEKKDNGKGNDRPAAEAPAAAPPAPPAPPAAAPPVATGGSRQPERRATAGGRPRQPRATAPVSRQGAAPAPAPAPVRAERPAAPPRERAAARPKPAPRVKSEDDRSAPAGTPNVLRRTVTQIVEVVPTWALVLVGVLGVLAVVLGVFSGVSAVRARRLELQRSRLAADVGLLQSALLPDLPARVGSADVSAAYRPADGPAAGGDFYDVFALPGDRTCVIVGDVTGHGRHALPLTALVRYTLRAYLEQGMTPRHALQAAGAVLDPQLRGQIVTAIAGVYDPLTGYLTYASAGHPQPIVIGDDRPPITACSSPPLGAGMPTGLREVVAPLPPGAAAFFYTDGLVDQRVEGERIGPDGLSIRVRALSPTAVAEDVVEPIAAAGPLADDMAACVLKPLPDAVSASPVRVEVLEVRGGEVDRSVIFLERCGLADDAIAAVMREARPIIAHGGAAVLEVARRDDEVTVEVRRPEFVSLPIRGRLPTGTSSDAASAV